ncbi:MYD88-like protein [Mya arenaria]|uniref:MYD88-like protein n=1 Tax=Mya arenaria TaxID=6604 RepID=A0ABY7E5D7_MYAAR|nr:MYD88-like protein [Mya arenaria]
MASAEPESCVSSKTSGFGKSGPEVYAAASERDRVDDSLVGAVGGSDSCRHSGGSNGGSSAASCQQQPISDTVKEEINQRIIKLEQQIQLLIDIPDFLLDVPLECLIEETKQSLTYFLDPEMDIQTSEGLCKDYRGVAEWLNLEDAFQRYIAKIDAKNKFNEVLSMWFKDAGREGIPPATVGKLRECLLAMDRLDAVDTMAAKITRDAMRWKKAALQANVRPPNRKDLSWQLTRHDVVMKTRTYYTCCIVHAPEDMEMARIIMNMFHHVHPDTRFFLPQFDLIEGSYVKEATARVIVERCNGKVIFIVSEYFVASDICRFAVNFCKESDMETNQGNLFPFMLTREEKIIPHVLLGIHGIKWYNRILRKKYLDMLIESVLDHGIGMEKILLAKARLEELLNEQPEVYLCDPPYERNHVAPQAPVVFYPDQEPEAPQMAIGPPAVECDEDIEEEEPLVDAETGVTSGRKKQRGRIILFGKETHYTACLMFADEDYGMAQIIMKLYKTAKKDSLFFLPQCR